MFAVHAIDRHVNDESMLGKAFLCVARRLRLVFDDEYAHGCSRSQYKKKGAASQRLFLPRITENFNRDHSPEARSWAEGPRKFLSIDDDLHDFAPVHVHRAGVRSENDGTRGGRGICRLAVVVGIGHCNGGQAGHGQRN